MYQGISVSFERYMSSGTSPAAARKPVESQAAAPAPQQQQQPPQQQQQEQQQEEGGEGSQPGERELQQRHGEQQVPQAPPSSAQA